MGDYMTNYPHISLLIPLYRAKPFLDCIIQNIEAVDYPNCEIIISDRHYLDTAIDILREKYANDPRVKILSFQDELNWVDHFNLLFQQATGKYLIRISQDDKLINYTLKEMVSCLEENPSIVLCYLPVVLTDMKGHFLGVINFLSEVQQVNDNEPWAFELTLNAYLAGYFSGAFSCGLFRRELLNKHLAYIRPTKRLIDSERLWDSNVGLLGRISMCVKGEYIKQQNPVGITSQWQRKPSDYLSNYIVMLSYLKDYCPSWKKRIGGAVYLFMMTWISIGARVYDWTSFKKVEAAFLRITRNKYGHRAFSMSPLSSDDIDNLEVKALLFPKKVIAGKKFIIRIQLINNSDRCLASYDPNPVFISYHWFDATKQICILFEGIRNPIIPYLPARQDREFLIAIEAPQIDGEYCLRITLVQELILWMDTVKSDVSLVVEADSGSIFPLDYLKRSKESS